MSPIWTISTSEPSSSMLANRIEPSSSGFHGERMKYSRPTRSAGGRTAKARGLADSRSSLPTPRTRARATRDATGLAELQIVDPDPEQVGVAPGRGLTVDLQRALGGLVDLGDPHGLAGRDVPVRAQRGPRRVGAEQRDRHRVGRDLAVYVEQRGLLLRTGLGIVGAAADRDQRLVHRHRAEQ